MHQSTATSVLGDVIDNRQIGAKQYEMLALCLLVAVLDGFDTQVVVFLVKPMADSLDIAPSAFGPVFAAALFGLMVGALLLAPLADCIGRKKVLIASVLTFGLADSLFDLELDSDGSGDGQRATVDRHRGDHPVQLRWRDRLGRAGPCDESPRHLPGAAR